MVELFLTRDGPVNKRKHLKFSIKCDSNIVPWSCGVVNRKTGLKQVEPSLSSSTALTGLGMPGGHAEMQLRDEAGNVSLSQGNRV